MTFDCSDPRSSKERPLRIQKTAPAGHTVESAKAWARESAEQFLAEILGKTMTRKEAKAETQPRPLSKARSQPKLDSQPETTTMFTVAEMFEQMQDRVIRHEEPTSQATWKSVWKCHLKPQFGEMPIHLVTKTRILDFRDGLQKRYATSTCNHIVAKLQGILSYAVEREMLVATPRIRRLRVQAATEKDPVSTPTGIRLNMPLKARA